MRISSADDGSVVMMSSGVCCFNACRICMEKNRPLKNTKQTAFFTGQRVIIIVRMWEAFE